MNVGGFYDRAYLKFSSMGCGRRRERLDNMAKKAALMKQTGMMATKHPTATSTEGNNNTR